MTLRFYYKHILMPGLFIRYKEHIMMKLLLTLAALIACTVSLSARGDSTNPLYDDPYFGEEINIETRIDTTVELHRVILKDGSEINGRIKEHCSDSIRVVTIGGLDVNIRKENIIEIAALYGQIVDGEFQRFDPNRTRLFFSPTARPLEAGEGYFSVYEIFFTMLTVGLSDWLAISGGTSLIPAAETQLVYLNLKVTPYHDDQFSLAFGGFQSWILDHSMGIAYGVTTFGSKNYALSIGLGFGNVDGEFTDTPALVVGADLRLSNSVKFISENWLVEEEFVYSFGLRFFGDNLAGDFGLFGTAATLEGFPFFPWIGITYNFGR